MTAAGSATAIRNLSARAWRRVRAAHKPLVRRARRRARQAERREVRREVATIERELGQIAAGRGPIIAGPWLGEVGYEALYWVPFLRWVQDAFRIRRERLVVVSRGGPHAWYEDFAGSYVEMFDLVEPGELASGNDARRRREEGGGRKQTAPGELDARILTLARRHAGLEAGRVCHPSLMFRLFRHVWHGALPYDDLWTRTRYARPSVTAPVLDGLPAEYSVVRFYTGVALPPVGWIRDRIRALVAREAGARAVVVLDPEVGVDEHEDYALLDIPNVVSARRWMRPATNLGVQTSLVAGAHRFLGTCGGLAWLAPFLGTPTVAVFADDRLLAPHLYVVRQAARAAGAAEFLAFDVRAEHGLGS